ncbi:MAG TPA: aspartate dehydrogenase [Thermomicrobiales bacterium]|nr:aspartate dehydrogenase [Thermomicrobiales bacterium]
MTAGPRRVALIGLGAIGRSVVEIAAAYPDEIAIVAACTRSGMSRYDDVTVRVVGSIRELLAHAPDVVVEVAGHDGLREHGPAVLRSGIDLIAVSVGALADPAVERDLLEAAREGGSQIRVASGAIGALDAIAAAAIGGIDSVTHTTRKPAHPLLGDEARSMTEARDVFHGPARAAALRYPESVNVTAAVSLAGIGLDRTEVRVIADPAVERNIHTVEVVGAFGSLIFEIRNVPSETNPKTGRIVAMSIVSTLRQARLPLSIG